MCPKERVKVRARELERLLVNVEDAELFTDRHNMMLFLQKDVSRENPARCEESRRIIFDPDDDEEIVPSPQSITETEGTKKEVKTKVNASSGVKDDGSVQIPLILSCASSKENSNDE